MMRFLAVYSTTPFQVICTNSEECSKFSERKSKNFSVTAHFKSPKSLENPAGMHFLAPCTVLFKLSGATLFFIFL